MPNQGLADYLQKLQQEAPDEVVVIKEPVPRDYVITAYALEMDRRSRFPVLIFEKVEGSELPIVTNVFARRSRIARMLGTEEGQLSQRWLELEGNRLPPMVVSGGPVKEVVTKGNQVDITTLPIMKHFVTDAGRYVTAGIVVAKDPDTGVRNLSFHRMQVKGPNKFGISLHSRQHLWDYFRRAEEKGKSLEVAVVIGAHPLILLAASAKTAISVDEYDIAGGLLGEPLELVAGETVDVEYPATAEIVIEGEILAGVREPEGPFGEYTGYSTSRSTENVLSVSALCRRSRPMYLSVVPAASSDHLNLMRVAKEALVLARLRERVPNVVGIHYPKSGVNFHCFLSMGPGPEGATKQAIMLLFGLDPYLKLVVAVDEDIDITDEREVLWAMATRMQGDKDVFVVPGVFTNRLDPSSSGGVGAKVGIDATRPANFEAVRCEVLAEHAARALALLRLPGS